MTSRIPLENIILLKDNAAYHVGNCFKERHTEGIIRDVNSQKQLNEKDVLGYRRMISRYFDVTRSQLLFSSGCLFIEGISESQLIETFSRLINKSLIEHQIEIVNTDGTAFYQFLMLFNAQSKNNRLPMKAAFITDEDQFTESKKPEYNLDELTKNNYTVLEHLRTGIYNDKINGRVSNMKAMANGQNNIMICSGIKTLEYQICKANVFASTESTKGTWLYELIKELNIVGIDKVDSYIKGFHDKGMNEEEQQNVALLMWKCLPGKADFAQTLNSFLLEKIEQGEDIKFTLPKYIQEAIDFLVQ